MRITGTSIASHTPPSNVHHTIKNIHLHIIYLELGASPRRQDVSELILVALVSQSSIQAMLLSGWYSYESSDSAPESWLLNRVSFLIIRDLIQIILF
jgi:hypothetical protein